MTSRDAGAPALLEVTVWEARHRVHPCRFHDEWEEQGHCPKELWRKAGDTGMLCATMPVEYGGAGCDILYSAGTPVHRHARVSQFRTSS